MAPDEKMLEELYELLTLYFEISPHGGLVKTFQTIQNVEPQLDRVILKDHIISKISTIIIEN